MRSALWVLGAVLLLGNAGICAWLFVAQRSMIFFPQFTRSDAAGTEVAIERDDGVVLRGWRLNPGGRDPVVYFGGNAERVELNRDLFSRIAPGRAVYLVAYRGYGASDGEPSAAALKADSLALYDHVQAAHPGQPVAVVGRSLGSGVAAHVAARRPVARLALVTPFDSLAAVAQAHYPWVPIRLLMREDLDSSAALRERRAMPVLVLRARADRIVPPANSERLLQALPHARDVVIDGVDHDSIPDAPAFAMELKRFLAGADASPALRTSARTHAATNAP